MAAPRALAGLLVLAVQTAEADPCAPRAELGGDADAVASVAVELKRLGVETDAAGAARTGCPTIVAAVELDRSGGIAVAVRDAAQRSEGRVVSDAALAAAWIDSWLRDDFTVPVVAEPAPIAASAAPGATRVDAAAEGDGAPLLERFAVAASFLQAWTDDSTRWSGAAASACVRLGGACIGARVAHARQDVLANGTGAAKRDYWLLATASASHALGTMSIAPELGIGVGRLSTERIEGCKVDVPNCMPDDPNCMIMEPADCTDPGTIYVGDGFHVATYTPRISAALRVAVPLFEHVWLDGLVAATIAPLGHHEDYGTAPAPNTMPPPDAALPGDPLLGLQLGIGLRVGAP